MDPRGAAAYYTLYMMNENSTRGTTTRIRVNPRITEECEASIVTFSGLKRRAWHTTLPRFYADLRGNVVNREHNTNPLTGRRHLLLLIWIDLRQPAEGLLQPTLPRTCCTPKAPGPQRAGFDPPRTSTSIMVRD